MIDIDLRSSVKQVLADMTAIGDGISRKASIRAVNVAVDAVATGANREVRKVYNLRARAVAAAITKKKASQRSKVVGGSVIFSGRNIALIEFDARWSRNMPGASVRIRLDTGRKTVAGAFITTTGSGTTGVFKRVGPARYPIKQLRSVSIPDTIRNKAVYAAVVELGEARFNREFLRQLAFLTSGKNG